MKKKIAMGLFITLMASSINVLAAENSIKSNNTKTNVTITSHVSTSKTFDANSFNSLTDSEIKQISQKIYEAKNKNSNITLDQLDTITINEINKIVSAKGQTSTKSIVSPASTGFYDPNNLNSEELKLVALYPTEAIIVKNCASEALNLAMSLYTDYSRDGNGDAFRHSYWNALMTAEIAFISGYSFNWSRGKDQALKWSTAHEYNAPEPSKSMDLYNNGVGARIAYYAATTNHTTLKNECISYINKGWMERIVGGRIVVTDSSNRK